MGLLDGIPSLEIRAATISGNTLNATDTTTSTLAAGASEIGAAELALGAVSGGAIGSGGVGRTHIALATVSGGHIISGGIAHAHLTISAASGNIVHPIFATAVVGSPSIVGMLVQGGSVSTGTATGTWVVFGRAFTGPPYVVTVTGRGTAASAFSAFNGSLTAGSMFVFGNANALVSWTAIGSGR